MNDSVGGIWFIYPPENSSDVPNFQSTQDDNNRVLIGQFTTGGILSANIDLQVEQ